jgi:hypothetical protein
MEITFQKRPNTLPSTMNSRNRCAYPTYLPGSKNTKYSFRVPGALYCAVLVFYNQCHLHVHICYRHYHKELAKTHFRIIEI